MQREGGSLVRKSPLTERDENVKRAKKNVQDLRKKESEAEKTLASSALKFEKEKAKSLALIQAKEAELQKLKAEAAQVLAEGELKLREEHAAVAMLNENTKESLRSFCCKSCDAVTNLQHCECNKYLYCEECRDKLQNCTRADCDDVSVFFCDEDECGGIKCGVCCEEIYCINCLEHVADQFSSCICGELSFCKTCGDSSVVKCANDECCQRFCDDACADNERHKSCADCANQYCEDCCDEEGKMTQCACEGSSYCNSCEDGNKKCGECGALFCDEDQCEEWQEKSCEECGNSYCGACQDKCFTQTRCGRDVCDNGDCDECPDCDECWGRY